MKKQDAILCIVGGILAIALLIGVIAFAVSFSNRLKGTQTNVPEESTEIVIPTHNTVPVSTASEPIETKAVETAPIFTEDSGLSDTEATSEATEATETIPETTVPETESTLPQETESDSDSTQRPTEGNANQNTDDSVFAEYVVQKGDTLAQIAAKYNVTVNAIAEFNGISAGNRPKVGSTLIIPLIEDWNLA